jgi:type I restriction enzyme S subunit
MYVVFKTKSDLLSNYLKHYLQTKKFNNQIKNNTAGSVRQSLNFSAFEFFDFLYPKSKTEQQKIVEVLGGIDEDIEKTQEVIRVTEKLRHGLMQLLFTHGIGDTKFTLKKLEELATISTGTTPSTSKKEYYEGSNPFIKTGEIVNKKIEQTDVYISDKAVKAYRLKKYQPGTILVAMYGQGKTRGQTAILGIDACITQNAAAIEPSKNINSEYLWFFLRSQYELLRD